MASTAAPIPNVDHLAGAFVGLLSASLTPRQLFQVQITNATAGEGVCASHDVCDANVYMAEAFELIARRPLPDFDHSDADVAAWNAAWDIARTRYLTDTTTTITSLTADYGVWLAAEGLPEVDGEELILDPALTPSQREWLSRFIERWEITQDAGRE